MAINRCANCKIGTSFCVYTRTVEVESIFGKKYQDVPANNCITNNGDDYALFPDTEEVDRGIGSVPFLENRICEAIDPTGIDPFTSNIHLYESITTNITTGDTYNIDETVPGILSLDVNGKRNKRPTMDRRFDYDHPLHHMIDYNVPNNKSGVVRLHENCFITGNGKTLVSKNWEMDDFGEAKKSIGIPQMRQCVGLYGTMNKQTGVITHKSMKDWTSSVPTFNNYTNQKVSKYSVAKYNIFQDDMVAIQTYVMTIIKNKTVRTRLYESFKLIKAGKYINIFGLLLNNGIERNDVFKITNIVSTKNPKVIYKNNEGHRYNIKKIKALYFNIIEDVIDIPIGKKIVLANIINFVLNDKDLMKHEIGNKKKAREYSEWYESVKDSFDEEFADELRPERVNLNDYSSDNNLKDAIDIIVNAIYEQKLLTVKDLPAEFSIMFKQHKNYNKTYKEERDIHEMGAATMNMEEVLNISIPEAYVSFTKMVQHLEMCTPHDMILIWNAYQESYKLNEPKSFWDLVDSLAEEYNQVGYKLNELFISEDTLDIVPIEATHSLYIRARNRRYYDIQNQDAEHFKLYDGMEDDEVSEAWGI